VAVLGGRTGENPQDFREELGVQVPPFALRAALRMSIRGVPRPIQVGELVGWSTVPNLLPLCLPVRALVGRAAAASRPRQRSEPASGRAVEREGRLPPEVIERRLQEDQRLGHRVEWERFEAVGELAELGDGGCAPRGDGRERLREGIVRHGVMV
jgi:hypothetical protein